MEIRNHIRVNGKYIPQEEIPADELERIRREPAIRLAEGFGYEPVDEKQGKPAV